MFPITISKLVIRAASPGDAVRFRALWEVLKHETEGLLFEEVTDQSVSTAARQRQQTRPNPGYEHILFIEDPMNDSLVGFVAGTRCQSVGPGNSLEIVIALRQTVSNMGWGYRLLCSIESLALGSNFQRLTLTVSASNAAALALYKKFGFEITNTDQDALKTHAGYVSLHTMQKSLRQLQWVATD